MITVTKEDIGKRVEFRALCYWNSAKATRIIKGVSKEGGLTVRFGGFDHFYVRPHEIIEIFKKE